MCNFVSASRLAKDLTDRHRPEVILELNAFMRPAIPYRFVFTSFSAIIICADGVPPYKSSFNFEESLDKVSRGVMHQPHETSLHTSLPYCFALINRTSSKTTEIVFGSRPDWLVLLKIRGLSPICALVLNDHLSSVAYSHLAPI